MALPPELLQALLAQAQEQGAVQQQSRPRSAYEDIVARERAHNRRVNSIKEGSIPQMSGAYQPLGGTDQSEAMTTANIARLNQAGPEANLLSLLNSFRSLGAMNTDPVSGARGNMDRYVADLTGLANRINENAALDLDAKRLAVAKARQDMRGPRLMFSTSGQAGPQRSTFADRQRERLMKELMFGMQQSQARNAEADAALAEFQARKAGSLQSEREKILGSGVVRDIINRILNG